MPEVFGAGARDAKAISFPDLDAALEGGKQCAYLRWGDRREMCALDIDVRAGFAFSQAELASLASAPAPRPTHAWLTRSNGLRLIFDADEEGTGYGLNAMQRAALYAFVTPAAVSSARVEAVELLRNTRLPPPHAVVLRPGGGYGVPDLSSRLRATGGEESCLPEEIDAWLNDRGMAAGERYPHSYCVIDPAATSRGDPVRVNDGGIFCHRCKERAGGGFRSYSSLIANGGKTEPNPLIATALHWCHWVHARQVLAAYRPAMTEPTLKLAYAALLRVLHSAALLSPDTQEETQTTMRAVWRSDLQVVRGETCWLHADNYRTHVKVGSETLKAMPWGRRSGPARERAATTAAIPGYVPIVPTLHLVHRPTLENGIVRVPMPVPLTETNQALTKADALALLREALPGTGADWGDHLCLLIAAILRAQLQLATPPMVILTGPSGAGKNAAADAAAGIVTGHPTTEIRASGGVELAMSIGEGLEAGAGMLLLDEAAKTSGGGWWENSGPLLRLGAHHTWRKLYAGTVTSAVRSAVVIAGSTLPVGLTTMHEFARRAVVCRFPRVDPSYTARWGDTVPAVLGCDMICNLRRSPLGTAVADALIRPAAADVRANTGSSWVTFAAARGGERLASDEAMSELQEIVRQLYLLWTTGPDSAFVPQDAKRNRGWLRCWVDQGSLSAPRNAGAALMQGWLAEDRSERRGQVNRLLTADVVVAAGLPVDTQISMRCNLRSARLAVRFVGQCDTLDRTDRALFPAPIVRMRA